MKKFWSEKGYQLYKKATSFWNYPEEPFGPYLKKIIKPTDIVADIGCGFGITSAYLAQFCSKVYAIDQDYFAIQKTKKNARKKQIDNIEAICAVWPEVNIEPCDVVIGLYHYHFAHEVPKIQKLKEITKRAGIISCQGIQERESFHLGLKKRLGLLAGELNCENGCYIRGRLEQAGFKVQCASVFHDFGQPVDSLEEATSFMLDQLKLDKSYTSAVYRLAGDYITIIKGQSIIPIKRYNCLLTYFV